MACHPARQSELEGKMNVKYTENMQRICIVALILVAVGCRKDAATSQPESLKAGPVNDNEQISEVVARLDAMPSWYAVDPNTPETRTAIKNKCEAIRVHYSHSIIREAIVRVLRTADPTTETAMASKVFVLNRFLFEVPEDADAATIRHFGGWVGVPVKNGRVDMLWPWCQDSNGLELKGSFQGYFGEGYDGVGEFDYFSAHYDGRKK
jgi:hypothetical protein